MPCLASHPGICLLSTPNNQFPTSLQKSYDDWICLLLKQGGKVKEGFGYPMGEFWHLSLPQLLRASWPFPCWVDFCQQLQSLGKHSGPSSWHGLFTSLLRQHHREETVWCITGLGEPQAGQGCHHGGGGWEISHLPLQWNGLALCPGTAIWGFWSCTTPQGQNLGILPQGKAEETSCGWISQLNVYQLLSASPQVVYPSGLNGHDEPIITTLPELLSSGVSVIASKHPYLEIDIPPKGESDTKVLPIGKASIIQTTNTHKSPLIQRAVWLQRSTTS